MLNDVCIFMYIYIYVYLQVYVYIIYMLAVLVGPLYLCIEFYLFFELDKKYSLVCTLILIA